MVSGEHLKYSVRDVYKRYTINYRRIIVVIFIIIIDNKQSDFVYNLHMKFKKINDKIIETSSIGCVSPVCYSFYFLRGDSDVQ